MISETRSIELLSNLGNAERKLPVNKTQSNSTKRTNNKSTRRVPRTPASDHVANSINKLHETQTIHNIK